MAPTTANTTTQRGLGADWQALTRKAWATYPPICHLCRQPIDRSLPKTDPMSGTIDHLDPRATHGKSLPTLDRVRPAHRSCNSTRGAGEPQPSWRSRTW
jgi:5-methylcytosine-specific restriction endonuclease McrA